MNMNKTDIKMLVDGNVATILLEAPENKPPTLELEALDKLDK